MSGELIIGLMSGTSTDGIDAVLVEFDSQHSLTVKARLFVPYSAKIQSRINYFAHSKKRLDKTEYQALDIELANCYAQTCLQLAKEGGTKLTKINAIANHGQTIAHDPGATPPYSLQIGDGQIVANKTGVKVITQFRQADIENGGQGAPLMPAFHQAIFTSTKSRKPRYVLKLGGIANLSYLGETVIGFDTGPANTLMNQWIKRCRVKDFDEEGRWAASGQTITQVLKKLLEDPYFNLPYPKSTGPDYLNLEWVNKRVGGIEQFNEVDMQATLLELSVETIALGIENITENQKLVKSGSIYVCGGGVKNTALLSQLTERLPNYEIALSDELGVPSDWVEAIGFAWLGYCYLKNIESNLPSVTGANKSLVLGQQYLPADLPDTLPAT